MSEDRRNWRCWPACWRRRSTWRRTYGFPWAIALTVVTAVHHCWRERRPVRGLVSIISIYGAVFLLTSAPWLAALHAEYGVWTPGVAARYNVHHSLLARGMGWSDGLADPGLHRRHLWDDSTRQADHERLDWARAPVTRALTRNLRSLGSILLDNPVAALAIACLWGQRGAAGFGGCAGGWRRSLRLDTY